MSQSIELGRPMERRDGLRRVCRAPITVFATQDCVEIDSFVLESSNLSGNGLFLQTDLLFPVGEWLELEFNIPGRPWPVRGRGRVVRVDARDEPPGPGVAVELEGLTGEERNALGRLGIPTWRVV